MAKREEASVVLITLVFMTVLMVLVATLATTMLGEMRITASSEDQAKSFYLAEAGLEYGRYILNDDDKWEEKDEGDEYRKPASDDWYEEIVGDGNQIELRRYEDKLRSIGYYDGGSSTLEIEYELGLVEFEEDILEKVPEGNEIEDKYISVDEADVKFSAHSLIKNTTIKSTGETEFDLAAQGRLENSIIESESKIDIKLSGQGDIDCLVLASEAGPIKIDLGPDVDLDNLFIYTDGDVVDESPHEHDYSVKDYDEYNLDSLDCDPGYQGREAYIEREGSWQEM